MDRRDFLLRITSVLGMIATGEFPAFSNDVQTTTNNEMIYRQLGKTGEPGTIAARNFV
jgi:hypothetical protein